MANPVKWYAVSLAVHLGLLIPLLALTETALHHTPPISIDFTINTCPVPEQLQGKPRMAIAAPQQPATPQATQHPVAVPVPTRVQQEQARPVSQPAPQLAPAVTQGATPTPSAPPAGKSVTNSTSGPVSANQETAVVAATPPGAQSGGGGMTAEKAQQRYLKEHFTYIRDLIIKRLTYPHVARRMGWSGRVVLAFVVAEDGSVRSIQVRESSGYSVLDNSAMATVKIVAPFPRPPVAAEIVMPVQFQLQ